MKAVAETLGESRSNPCARRSGQVKPHRAYRKVADADLLPRILTLVAERPSYGYRRIGAVLNRILQTQGLGLVNHKRVYRIMQTNDLLQNPPF